MKELHEFKDKELEKAFQNLLKSSEVNELSNELATNIYVRDKYFMRVAFQKGFYYGKGIWSLGAI